MGLGSAAPAIQLRPLPPPAGARATAAAPDPAFGARREQVPDPDVREGAASHDAVVSTP